MKLLELLDQPAGVGVIKHSAACCAVGAPREAGVSARTSRREVNEEDDIAVEVVIVEGNDCQRMVLPVMANVASFPRTQRLHSCNNVPDPPWGFRNLGVHPLGPGGPPAPAIALLGLSWVGGHLAQAALVGHTGLTIKYGLA